MKIKRALFAVSLAASTAAVAQGTAVGNAMRALFSSDYLPHRYCYLAKPWLVWTNVSTDTAIAVAYAALFGCLTWIAVQLAKLPALRKYLWVFLSFGAFILACGLTHLMEVITVWAPLYPISAMMKVVCAAVSLPTAVIFAMKTPAITEAIREYLETLSATTQQRDSAWVQLEREQLLREKRIEALSHMAGGLAHEISNPLAIIHGKASDLERQAASGEVTAEEVRAACAGVVQTAERAMKILRGLRGFGREAAKDPLEQADVSEIVDGCIELQQSRMEREHVDLMVDIEPGLPNILCRETQIGQILTNLLNNGFDAIVQSDAAERWIELKARVVGREVYIDVTNSGPKIDEHLKAHLMEPFFTTKEFSMGTGVGLSLSRAIAQDHGGTLTLCDGMENTCFRLTVPIRPDFAESEAGAATSDLLRSGDLDDLGGALSR